MANSTYELFDVDLSQSIENMQLPDPELMMFYRNLQNRVIWLDCEVNDMFLEYGRYIIQWNREDKGKQAEERKPIKLMFFSPGGSLDINNVMIDIIKMSKTPIYGYNVGEASSAACYIFMSCHKRFALPKSIFLLHKGSGNFGGTYEEVIGAATEYERKIGELCDFVLSHSKIPKNELEENIRGDWYIPAKKAIDYGFCDAIIDDIDELI